MMATRIDEAQEVNRKARAVIDSCRTLEQLENAERYCRLTLRAFRGRWSTYCYTVKLDEKRAEIERRAWGLV